MITEQIYAYKQLEPRPKPRQINKVTLMTIYTLPTPGLRLSTLTKELMVTTRKALCMN